MPASVDTDEPRNPSLLTALFWVGVALAPVAALILLIADGNGPLRFAAVLAILAVVLIGLSIALRADGGSAQLPAELREEIEQLRRELHGEIVAAAQRGNQALDQAHQAHEAVVALRRRLDAGAAARSNGADAGGAGRARVPTVEPAGRPAGEARWGGTDREDQVDPTRPADRPTVDAHATDRPATGSANVYGGDQSAGGYGGYGGYGGDRASGGHAAERSATGYGTWSAESEGQPGRRSRGVVQRTETVHVTTRHTIVDGSGVGEDGTRYGGYRGRRSARAEEPSWSGGDEGSSWSGHSDADGRSWSGGNERSRPRDEPGWTDRDESAPAGQQWNDRGWSDQRDDRGWGGEQSWDTSAEQYGRIRSTAPDGGAADGEYWSQARAGDRWAAVRDDDRGRELRMGELRAELHTDQVGTEFRVADRWAAVRRDEGRDPDDAWQGSWVESEDRPALPPGGVPVPDEWRASPRREPEHQWSPESGRHGYPSRDDASRGGARSTDRWR
ncbi:hypothetical protein QTQ03_17220 [Micromonospora sp. WMMA1363]|uniref:hypothetical protein n=1 Tax=Micromonospora sp. WMMA1363 TaxID=3053985 RepID=UPI00259CC8D6|nr:hypothetical protein [Micromonospora sp. WMMA1363]MDM4721258.1 hypothetical protein [Micromonospora sp. WMMA1363]